LGFAQ